MRLAAGTPRDGLTLTPGRLDTVRADTAARVEDPVLDAALGVLDEPLAELVVEVTGPDGRRSAAFSLGSEVAAVVLTRPERDPELAAVTVESVPAVIARTVGLGPAPYRDVPPLTVPVRDIDALLLPSPGLSPALASHPVADMLRPSTPQDVLPSPWRLWRLELAAPDAENTPRGARLDVLGARDHGWWVLAPEGEAHTPEEVTLYPTTATALWRTLAGLLG